MRSFLTGVVALLGVAGVSSADRGADLEDDEVARRAALRRPAHDLVADLGHRQHVPGHAGGAGLGRQDGDPLSRQVVDDQRGRQDSTPSSCATTCTFCSGKKFTAADVVYSLQAPDQDPETKAPLAWRAGNIKEMRAPDPYTVEYELNEPYSELLLHLTMFTNADPQQGERRVARQGLRRQGDRRHRAVVLRELAAAHRDRAEAPRRLQMGPVDVPEQGPGEVREALHQDRAGGLRAASPP